MLALLALTAGNLAFVAWRGGARDRARALGLLFFLGASGMLALGVGRARAGHGFETAFRYTLLAIPILCCVYLAWEFPRSGRAGHLVRACLLAAAGLAIGVDIPRRIRAAEEEHASGLALERDIRRGMPPYGLIGRYNQRLKLWSLDPGSKLLSMLRRSRIGPFRTLRDDPAFRVAPLPLTVAEEKGVEVEEGMVHGTSGESYLTFALPKPTFVAAIRVHWSTPGVGAPIFGLAWRRGGDRDFPEPQFTGNWPVPEVTIAVADTIDRIRIYPDKNPIGSRSFDFQIPKLELVVPADGDALADGPERGVPVSLRPTPTPGRPGPFDR
jgi:hypothetical protein